MKVKFLGKKGTWREVANSCNTTIHKEEGGKEPSSVWKKRILLSEHSPIRQISFKWKWIDLKYWVSVHLVRHWLGIIHWVRTQRTDRTNIDRNELKQSAFVEHEAEANIQALINISRKRLCFQASSKTREAWEKVVEIIKKVDKEIGSVLVKECVYRNGLCPEFKTCGYNKTEKFKKELEEYTEIIKEQISK